MSSGLYVDLSALLALEKRMDTIANNVANLATVGYRADAVHFATLLAQTGTSTVAFASPGTTYISRASGEMTKTGNPLDVAVQGDGWLAVQTPNGIVYTRDGRMVMSPTGALQTLNGYPILDAGSAPLVVDPNGGPLEIARDGMITQAGRQIGAIGLFGIDPKANLSRADNSGVVPDLPATPILDFTSNGIMQGFVEGANVNPVMEMANLIRVTRTFEDVAAMSRTTDTSLQDAIKTLGSFS